MTQAALDSLCTELRGELRKNPRGTGVAGLLARYAEENVDWREYSFFAEESYTRNLVHRCEEYELLLLCWGEGHESPIHNHDSQNCWMAVLEGELEEVQFGFPAQGSAAPLVQTGAKEFSPTGVAFIQDGIGLHLIRPVHGTRGISLHLYSRAIDQCRIYDPETGASTLAELGYHSVRGELCHRSPDLVRAEWAGSQGTSDPER